MKSMKKLGLIFSAIAFCLGVFVISGDAQNRGNRRWENNRRDRDVQSSRIYQNRNRNSRYQRNRRITPREYYRSSQQRNRYQRTRQRYQRSDGYINKRESQRLERLRERYRRNDRRDRRNW